MGVDPESTSSIPIHNSTDQQNQMTAGGTLGIFESSDGTVSPLSRRSISPIVYWNGSEDVRASTRLSNYQNQHTSRTWNTATLVRQSFHNDPIPTHTTTQSSVSLTAYPPHPTSLSSSFQSGHDPFHSKSQLNGRVAPQSKSKTDGSPLAKRFLGVLRYGRNSTSDDINSPPSSTTTTPGTMFSSSPSQSQPGPSTSSRRPILPEWRSNGPPTDPPSRSSVAIGDQRIVEGLLDPRLELMNLESTASLGDHVDYSRPIRGLVHNMHNSTTTLSHDYPVEGNHHAF
jgi:hypothetical protein